jgi:hypothetical protein
MKVLVLDSSGSHATIVVKVIKMMNPQADVTSFPIGDKFGVTVNNKLAEGLVHALINDYNIINISMGLRYANTEVKSLIDKLVEKGVIICSASGNNIESYPANYDGVISVGSCDAMGNKTEYTKENYDVLVFDEVLIDGKIYQGTSFACAKFVGMLSRIGR